ncbi:nucleoside recognition domain-containing protein [Ureibacillus acetophenoni]|uniref:Nucleoside transporter/FeoB GTPase Gate domain-containing protein n=1 Tax=Ureibacillus acetophenoni TaxID=614649 RepID=A0A285U350_9BACL|nr:nucleoside recognition domain-containing protein [Ureibacillus acetophenoni]SOC35838.1 hypothetical protein SAMN05877842_1021 [Ureibacillus acetophenoni]
MHHSRKTWSPIEVVGLVIVIVALVALLFAPHSLSQLFDLTINEVYNVVVPIFLTGTVGIAIIVSVILGRILERLGFTDALIRLFVPIMKWMRINPTVIIPSVYNILGDINAAGKIAAPVLDKAHATKAEQKIAVATMIQSPQSFATFVLGLFALSAAGISLFPVIVLSIFVPLIIVPFLLSRTIYRDTKKVDLHELPRFTPKTKPLETLFQSAKEGTELLLLVIIPAVAAVFFIIGILKFIGVWEFINSILTVTLTYLSIEPSSGIISILAAPTLAVAQLAEIANSIPPGLVVGSFVLANSGLPLSVIFGQMPATWKECSSLKEKDVIEAALVGLVIRFATAWFLGFVVTPFLVV